MQIKATHNSNYSYYDNNYNYYYCKLPRLKASGFPVIDLLYQPDLSMLSTQGILVVDFNCS